MDNELVELMARAFQSVDHRKTTSSEAAQAIIQALTDAGIVLCKGEAVAWQPIESCPDTAEVIMFYKPNEPYVMARSDDYRAYPHWLDRATHWRALPTPPTVAT